MVNLTARKLAIATSISNELLVDGPTYRRQLEPHLRAAAGWHLDLAFLRGIGAGQPLGILNDPALITVNAESGQTADSIVTQNILNMWARLHPAAAPSAVWIIHSSTFPMLAQLVLGSGTAVTLLFNPMTTVPGAIGTMLGRPVFQSEKVPPLGDAGDILLVAPRFYVVGMRAQMTLQTSMHAGWSTDSTKIRLILRADGLGSWSQPIVPYGSTATQSWCVQLEARA
jgi:HK97 family phage major capsid protein